MSTKPASTPARRTTAPAKQTATPTSSRKAPVRKAAATAGAIASAKVPSAKPPPGEGKARTVPGEPAAKARARPVPKTDAIRETVLPSLRFHHSHALRQKTWALLDEIEAASHPRGHNEAFADLVAELVQAGMDWYFLRPLQRARVGFMAEQSAKLGLSGATRMINSASRGFILRMDLPQLRVVAGYLREIG